MYIYIYIFIYVCLFGHVSARPSACLPVNIHALAMPPYLCMYICIYIYVVCTHLYDTHQHTHTIQLLTVHIKHVSVCTTHPRIAIQRLLYADKHCNMHMTRL